MLFIRMYFSVRALITPRLKAVTGRPLKNRYLGENNELLRLGKRIGSPRNDQNVLQNDYCSDLPTTTATARVRTALELRRLVSGGGSRRAQMTLSIFGSRDYCYRTIGIDFAIRYARLFIYFFVPPTRVPSTDHQHSTTAAASTDPLRRLEPAI
ncbi:hypothetical protein QTP88_007114 [Uroleucon formosanum]